MCVTSMSRAAAKCGQRSRRRASNAWKQAGRRLFFLRALRRGLLRRWCGVALQAHAAVCASEVLLQGRFGCFAIAAAQGLNDGAVISKRLARVVLSLLTEPGRVQEKLPELR